MHLSGEEKALGIFALSSLLAAPCTRCLLKNRKEKTTPFGVNVLKSQV